MLENLSMPASQVIPVLGYPDVRRAVEWLCRSFGFTERLRMGEHRSQLVYRDGAVVVTQHMRENASHGMSIMLRVEGVDGLFERAQAAGATVVSAPCTYPYGERQCTVTDLGGHQWTLSETIENVSPGTWGGELNH